LDDREDIPVDTGQCGSAFSFPVLDTPDILFDKKDVYWMLDKREWDIVVRKGGHTPKNPSHLT